MAAERDLELLDDYLANRLDGNTRSAFEQKLETDPGLKSELELQQQFINGIKKARVAELKAIMNNVPIPAAQTGGTAVAAKVAVWAVVAGIVGTSIYLFLNQPEETLPVTPETKIEQQEKEIPATPSDSSQEVPTQPHEVSPVVSEEESSSEQQPAESPKATRKNKKTKEEPAKNPKVDVYDPTKEEINNEPAQPEANDGSIPAITHDDVAVEIDSDNKKYTFHYQFKSGKLFLYGPFEKNLYEILEFFSDDNKRTLFLFYKEEYYLLKDDNQRLKPLNAIQDPALVKKLKEYRN
jgi:hypothetical protein